MRTAKDNRLFVEALIYRYKTRIFWRDLPIRFGDFRILYSRYSRCSKKGVWKIILDAFSEDADNEYAMIDSTIVKAHRYSAGDKKSSDPKNN